MYNRYATNQRPLTNEDIQVRCPSAFATAPFNKMSDKYRFISTVEVIEEMRKNGLVPFAASQSNTRIEGKYDFTRHMIRFRGTDTQPITHLGQLFPELVLINSHDGTSCYELSAGLLRLACMNGLMVSESQIEQIKVRHTGKLDDIIDASFEVVEQFPKVIESVEKWQATPLNKSEQLAYAESALSLKYDKPPIEPNALLVPRRYDDTPTNVWNTFNTVQENLVKGGLRGRNENGRRLRTRAVTSITEDARLNRALWTLTERLAGLKG